MLAGILAGAMAFHANAAETFNLAITGPFSGGSAPMGVSMRDGAMLAVDQINAKGGIEIGDKKVKIKVIERDDQGQNQRGALVAQELASMPGLSAVIGTVNTGVAIAGDKFLQAAKIVKMVTPSSGTAAMAQWARPTVKDLYMFRFSADDGIQSQMVVEQAAKMGFKKVAIFNDTTNYGVSGRNDLMRRIKQNGHIKVVDHEEFAIGEKDMTAQVLRARASGAQAVLIWGIGPELAAVANDMAKIGYHVPLIGGWTLSMSNFLDNAGKNADGTMTPQSFIQQPVNPIAATFIKEYQAAYHVKTIPSPMSAAEGYDAVLVMAAAVHQADSTNSTKIRDALEDLKSPVKGVIATWNHPYSKWNWKNPDSHEAFRRDDVVMGLVKGGRIVYANAEEREREAKRR
jgi:branched-chain amino acid transport system substrate-binding protein